MSNHTAGNAAPATTVILRAAVADKGRLLTGSIAPSLRGDLSGNCGECDRGVATKLPDIRARSLPSGTFPRSFVQIKINSR